MNGRHASGVGARENVRKRVLIQAAACNIGCSCRQTGVGTPRSLQGRALSAIYGLIGRWRGCWERLRRVWGDDASSAAKSRWPRYTFRSAPPQEAADNLVPRASTCIGVVSMSRRTARRRPVVVGSAQAYGGPLHARLQSSLSIADGGPSSVRRLALAGPMRAHCAAVNTGPACGRSSGGTPAHRKGRTDRRAAGRPDGRRSRATGRGTPSDRNGPADRDVFRWNAGWRRRSEISFFALRFASSSGLSNVCRRPSWRHVHVPRSPSTIPGWLLISTR